MRKWHQWIINCDIIIRSSHLHTCVYGIWSINHLWIMWPFTDMAAFNLAANKLQPPVCIPSIYSIVWTIGRNGSKGEYASVWLCSCCWNNLTLNTVETHCYVCSIKRNWREQMRSRSHQWTDCRMFWPLRPSPAMHTYLFTINWSLI